MKTAFQEMNRRSKGKIIESASDLVGGRSSVLLNAAGKPIPPTPIMGKLKDNKAAEVVGSDSSQAMGGGNQDTPSFTTEITVAELDSVINALPALQELEEEEAQEVATVIIMKRRREASFGLKPGWGHRYLPIKKELPRGWSGNEFFEDGATYQKKNKRGTRTLLHVIATFKLEDNGERLIHLTISKRLSPVKKNKDLIPALPSHDEMMEIKRIFIGPNQVAYNVLRDERDPNKDVCHIFSAVNLHRAPVLLPEELDEMKEKEEQEIIIPTLEEIEASRID